MDFRLSEADRVLIEHVREFGTKYFNQDTVVLFFFIYLVCDQSYQSALFCIKLDRIKHSSMNNLHIKWSVYII